MADPQPRIATHVWIGALRRRVEAAGGTVTILKRGERDAGAVLLLLRERTGGVRVLQRANIGGDTAWRTLASAADERDPALAESLEKQRRFDPDLWLVELDIADPARFVDGDIAD